MATLSEDKDSWNAGGVIWRDFRHTHNGPEVSTFKKKPKKPRKKIDHRHVFVDVTGTAEAPRWTLPYLTPYPWHHRRTRRVFQCAEDGCDKRNYEYEWTKVG
jgi:hypothetical protein